VSADPAEDASPPRDGSRRSVSRPVRAAALLGIAALVVLAVAAASLGVGSARREVETGIVVAVQATSLSDVQGFSIRTADGRTVDFRVTTLENVATFAPGHLAEHRVSLAPVRVTYVREAGANRAVRIEDAP
jgi:hypothetical protein